VRYQNRIRRTAQKTVAHHARTQSRASGGSGRRSSRTAGRPRAEMPAVVNVGHVERRTETGRLHPQTDRPARVGGRSRLMVIPHLGETSHGPAGSCATRESEGGVSARALSGVPESVRQKTPSPPVPRATVLADDAATGPRSQVEHESGTASGAAHAGEGACNRPDQSRQVCGEAGADQWGDADPRRGTATFRCPTLDPRSSDGPANRLETTQEVKTPGCATPGRFGRSSECRRARVHRVRRGRPSRSPERRTGRRQRVAAVWTP
jgi:hypothetical protein